MATLPKIFARVLCIGLAIMVLSTQTVTGDEPLPKGEFLLTGVEVSAIDRTKTADGKINDKKSDTLTHWIRFDVQPKSEKRKDSDDEPFKILNPTVVMKLTLDKPVKFRDEVVPAGTNLLDHKEFNGRTFTVSMAKLSPLVVSSVRINSDFEIPADTYTVKFEWTTDSGATLTDSVKVKIDVELP